MPCTLCYVPSVRPIHGAVGIPSPRSSDFMEVQRMHSGPPRYRTSPRVRTFTTPKQGNCLRPRGAPISRKRNWGSGVGQVTGVSRKTDPDICRYPNSRYTQRILHKDRDLDRLVEPNQTHPNATVDSTSRHQHQLLLDT